MRKKIGVLALQGDFEAHMRALEGAGAEAVQVRTREELDGVDALVIPGGESTAMLKLLNGSGLMEALSDFAEAKPVFGTCAGAILLASEVTHPAQQSLAVMDMSVERNAYGRQLDSRIVHLNPEESGSQELPAQTEAVFIRAPVIRRVGPGGKVLLRYNGDPVLVEQGKHLAATFHPELSGTCDVHRLFLKKVQNGTLLPSA